MQDADIKSAIASLAFLEKSNVAIVIKEKFLFIKYNSKYVFTDITFACHKSFIVFVKEHIALCSPI